MVSRYGTTTNLRLLNKIKIRKEEATMFTIITENNYSSIMDFPAWSGGAQTLALVKEQGLEDELQELFENSFDTTEPIEETELNDWLWFEVDLDELCQEEEEEEF